MDVKQQLEKTLSSFETELRSLRVGRASADLVEDITVEAYGSEMPIKELASISTPQHDQLVIQPWDASILEQIEAAIRKKTDGKLNPAAEGNVLRIALPPLTEETRKELVKQVHAKAEEARIAIRNVREDKVRDIDKAEKEKEISEDEKFQQKDELQKVVDEYNKKIEEIAEQKEKEIMER